jgi:hypothetical protein
LARTERPIDLRTPLGLQSAFAFPLQTRESQKELFIGAGLLLLPIVGWLLNMGHRVQRAMTQYPTILSPAVGRD